MGYTIQQYVIHQTSINDQQPTMKTQHQKQKQKKEKKK